MGWDVGAQRIPKKKTLTSTEKHTGTFIKNLSCRSQVDARKEFLPNDMGGYKKGLAQGTLRKSYSIPAPPAFSNPANSLQLLRGDPVVTLRAASPCTLKAPGVEQYTASHPELLK